MPTKTYKERSLSGGILEIRSKYTLSLGIMGALWGLLRPWPAEASLASSSSRAGQGTLQSDGMPLDKTPTHIRHKAGRQCLLEHCIPVHVGQVGCALNVTEAGQAALGILGQELQADGKHAYTSQVPR